MNALEGEAKSIAASGEFADAFGLGTVYKVFGVILTGGADAASLSLRSGGAAGSVLIPPIKAAINTTVVVMFPVAISFTAGVYGTITGTTPDATVLLKKVA